MKIIDVKFEYIDHMGETFITAVYEDGSEEFLFGYFSEEYIITRDELVGLTKEQAFKVKTNKDYIYLSSM